MGSAVVKPLTRRRGKFKKNKVAVDTAKGNEGQNVTGSCEPIVNRKVNSLPDAAKNLRQPFFGKSCKVDVDNTQSNRKICCTYPFLNGKTNAYDSDEELCQIQLVRKENASPSQTKNNQCNGTHPSENSTSVSIPSLAPTCTSLLSPSQGTHPITRAKVTSVSSDINTISCPEVRLSQKSEDGKDKDRVLKKFVEPEDEVQVIELTEAVNPEDQDVSRDARTPSPEYDDLEDVKVINPNPSSTEPCAASPSLEGCGQSSETKIVPTSEIDVSISKTQQPAPERRGEQRMEVGHMVFIKLSTSKENVESEYQGGGEPSSALLEHSQDIQFILQTTEPHPFEAQREELFYEKDANNIIDDRNLPLCMNSPRSCSSKSDNVSFTLKGESDLPLECNENNAINSTQNFGVVRDALLISRSNRSSRTSLHNKCKIPGSDKSSDILSLNHPHVEEVLAVGEEFVDDIDEGFLLQNNVQSPYRETRKFVAPIKEVDSRDYLPYVSLKTVTNVFEEGSPSRTVESPHRAVGSPHSSLCSSKNSEISIGQHHSRPTSDAEISAMLNDALQARDNIKTVKPFSRPSSAASGARPQSSNQEISHEKGRHFLGQNIMKCEYVQGIASVDDVIPKDSIIPSREYSSKESLNNFGVIQSQSVSSTCKQTQKVSSRASTPRAVTTASVESNKISSRPPSSKRSCSSAEQTQGRLRLNSSKQSADISDTQLTNARPQSIHSKQSSCASRPPSGLSSRLHCNLEVSAEGDNMMNSTVVLTSSQMCSVSETAIACGGETVLIDASVHLLNMKDSDSVGSKSVQTSLTPVAVMSTTELTAICDSTGSPNHWKAETPVEPNEGFSSFDHGCFPGLDTKSNPTTKSLSRSSMSSKTGANDEQEEQSQENLATPKETIIPSQPSLSPRNDCLTTKTSASQIRANSEIGPLDEASSSAALAVQPYCLSPDKIGNIRKQLYEEGLKPAEREGGVAFFIPVTEDGLLPQIDGAAVAERLTKTKKASLNYEERMFLANINRQVQLSKRKEFAVRDIRNVKGATSSSDGSDRTKQNDDVDEFDASF